MEDEKLFVPGTFGCHEVLHMTGYLANSVKSELCEHKAIQLNPKWLELAKQAQLALGNLYQAIGSEHLKDIEE